MAAIGTIADWRAWATARGDNKPTDANDTVANAALMRASDYIRAHYVLRFIDGYDEVSEGVEEATYVAADLELATPNFFSTTFTPSEKKVLTGVGSIKWTLVGKAKGSMAYTPTSNRIEALLTRYIDYGVTGLVV